jgi:hypothetical protein
MTIRTIRPRRAKAWWTGQQVQLQVDDRDAIEAFLTARSDSLDIGWCQRDESLSFTRIPLRTRL